MEARLFRQMVIVRMANAKLSCALVCSALLPAAAGVARFGAGGRPPDPADGVKNLWTQWPDSVS